MILTVDPGIRGCGAALWDFEGELVRAEYVRNPIREGDEPRAIVHMARAVAAFAEVRGGVSLAIVEWPQIYTIDKQKGDQNDLLPLAAVDAAICSLLECEAKRYRPAEWKGQIKPNVCAQRILARIEKHEEPRIAGLEKFRERLNRAIAAKKEVDGTEHNTIDAVGIGLKHFGRFEPRRVIAR